MIIPVSFQLYGQTIRVEYVSDLLHAHDSYGMTELESNLIKLQPNTSVTPINKDIIETVFLHEAIHQILDKLGGKYAEELNSDEDFVERFAKLLHQMLITQKGYLQYNESTREDIQGCGEQAPGRPTGDTDSM